MKQQQLISVIMNCYNGEKYLKQAITSVLRQTYQNWELIFWDNQSTDSSAEIVHGCRDSRIKYFVAPQHTWLYEARNYAIEKSNGEFLAFLDVDDWWLPEKLEKQLPLFAAADVGFACSNYWIESERKRKRWLALKRSAPTGWVLNDLLRSYFVGLVTLVVRRSALTSLERPCDPRYHIIGDTDLVIRLSIKWKLGCIQEPLAVYRLHGGNEIARHRGRQIDELKCWLSEMQEVEAIRSCPDFTTLVNYFTYLEIMHHILLSERRAAYRLLRKLPWGLPKLRLCAALTLPTSVVREIKN